MIAAGFSPGRIRCPSALDGGLAPQRGVEKFEERLKLGMKARGYPESFADRVFEQMKGFGSYGFPESHAASFAILVYFSAWIKRHYPAVFLASLINSQPLGSTRPANSFKMPNGMVLKFGRLMCPTANTTAPWSRPTRELWLFGWGYASCRGYLPQPFSDWCKRASNAPSPTPKTWPCEAQLEQSDVRALAAADALLSLAGHRRQQVWDSSALHRAPQLLREAPVNETPLQLPQAPEGRRNRVRLRLPGPHAEATPLALLRPQLANQRLITAQNWPLIRTAAWPGHAASSPLRQQPETAGRVVFVTLEDETGTVNVII